MDGGYVVGEDGTPQEGRSATPRRRRQPEVVLGGSIIRAPNGYRAIPQYTPAYPTPQTVKQIYSNARARRYPSKWDGKEPDAALTIYLTDAFTIVTACHNRSLGRFVAYQAEGEYGIIRDEAVQRHPTGNSPPSEFVGKPNDAFEAKQPLFWIEGEIAGHAAKASARFRCPKCRRAFNPRNLRRLGKELFEQRPKRYELLAP